MSSCKLKRDGEMINKMNNEFNNTNYAQLDKYISGKPILNKQDIKLNADDILMTVVSMILMFLILIILPLCIMLTNIYKQGLTVSFLNSYDSCATIDTLYNKQIYRKVRNV